MKKIRSKFKLYRREKINLFLKNRFMNYSLSKKNLDNDLKNIDYLPTHFSNQFKEKQKLKIIYGVSEKQFSSYYFKSKKMDGNLSENLLKILESRLDNIIYRIGIALTRSESKQIINHNHILLNNKICNIPSVIVKLGDIVSLNLFFVNKIRIVNNFILFLKKKIYNPWIFINFQKFFCYLKRYPEIFEINISIDENLALDFYTR